MKISTPAFPKTRRRPKLPWVIGGLLMVVVVGLGSFALMLFTAKPEPTVDYSTLLYAHLREAQGDGPSGWSALEFAAESAQSIVNGVDDPDTEDFEYFEVTRIIHDPYDPERFHIEKAALDQLREEKVWDLFDQAWTFAHHTRQYAPFASLEEMLEFRTTGFFRLVGRALLGEMRISIREGRTEDFVRACKHALRLSEASGKQGLLVYSLIGIAMEQGILTELGHNLMETELDEATCRRLLTIIEQHATAHSLAGCMMGEKYFILDNFQRRFTPAGRLPWSEAMSMRQERIDGGPFPILTGGGESDVPRWPYIEATLIPSRTEAERVVTMYYDEMTRIMALPKYQRDQDPFDPRAHWDAVPENIVILHDFGSDMPMLGSPLDYASIVESRAGATRLMLMIEMFEDRFGRVPVALDELVPTFTETLPIDPINGESYGYRTLADDPDGRPYLIYSFGLDGRDDGGYALMNPVPWGSFFAPGEEEEEPRLAQSEAPMKEVDEGSQFDFVFNMPRFIWRE